MCWLIAMRDNDGRKLDHVTLEVLRMRAVDLVVAGASAAEVAETLGLHRGSVHRWWARFERGGRDVLKAKPVPGRPATLSDHQLARLRDILAHKDPRQLQFDFGMWTRDMIAIVVERQFDVRLHRTTIGRVLRKLGFSPQRPLRRAWQQDPEAVRTWKNETFPSGRGAQNGAVVELPRSNRRAGWPLARTLTGRPILLDRDIQDPGQKSTDCSCRRLLPRPGSPVNGHVTKS